MKKKLLILLVFLLILVGVSCIVMQVKKKNVEENKTPEVSEFETKVKEMYGVQGYLGPMTEEIDPLTEEELQELNPGFKLEEKTKHIEARIGKLPILDVYMARKVMYSVCHILQVSADENTFLYGTMYEDEGSGERTYRFVRMYEGVMVPVDYIDVIVDKQGNAIGVYNMYLTEGDLGIDSVEPQVSEAELLALFEENFKGYKLHDNKLYILTSLNNEIKLIWVLSVTPPEGQNMTVIHIDANTGEEIVYQSSGQNDIKDDKIEEQEIVSYGVITYEQLLEWNPDGELQMLSSDHGETLSHLYGRFTEKPIEEVQDVIAAIWSVGPWIGLDFATDTFEVYREISDETGTVYHIDQYYNDIRVIGGGMIVATDEEGFGDYLSSGYQMIPQMSVEPVMGEDDLLEILLASYDDCEIKSSELVLYYWDDAYRLTWRLDLELDGKYYEVGIDDTTGEIIYQDDGVIY